MLFINYSLVVLLFRSAPVFMWKKELLTRSRDWFSQAFNGGRRGGYNTHDTRTHAHAQPGSA